MIGFSTGLSAGIRKNDSDPSTEATDVQLEGKLRPKIISRVYSEDVQGLNSDARLLLKTSVPDDIWGRWKDLDSFVPLLAQGEDERLHGLNCTDSAEPLKVQAFFCASDVMIGTTAGPQWHDACWRREQRGDHIEYSSKVVPGTDHDNLLNIEFGVFEEILSNLPKAAL